MYKKAKNTTFVSALVTMFNSAVIFALTVAAFAAPITSQNCGYGSYTRKYDGCSSSAYCLGGVCTRSHYTRGSETQILCAPQNPFGFFSRSHLSCPPGYRCLADGPIGSCVYDLNNNDD